MDSVDREKNGSSVLVFVGYLLVIFVIVVAFFLALSVYLQWTVFEGMYSVKMGLDWFNTVFYHGYSFIIPAVIAFATIFPFPNRSDLFSLFGVASKARRSGEEDNPTEPYRPVAGTRTLWVIWQAIKWMIAYAIAYSVNGFLFYPNLTEALTLAQYGFGSWSLVPRVLTLPIFPASGQEIISLIPTMEAQYYLVVGAVGTVLVILAIRFFLKFVRDLWQKTGNKWIIDILAFGLVVAASFWLGAPYWLMNVMTPYLYSVVILAMVGFSYGIAYFRLSGKGLIPVTARRRAVTKVAAVVIVALLLINAAALVYLSVNWNNNWLSYAWSPQIQKQITVTRWAAGISNVNASYVSSIPTGNVTQMLSLVRQWDNNASYIRSQSQIGVNYLAIPNSEIVDLNQTEYWIQPTTIIYPPGGTDWISEHLIYTHADRVIVLNAHTGAYVSLSQALKTSPKPSIDNPLIYYGEGGGFVNEVYPNVSGEPPQIGGVTYNWAPDFTLSGAFRTLWFFSKGPSTWGFAFSPPQDRIMVLYNRDILSRVSSTLINGLVVDPQTYLVTDGTNLYYSMQVYIDYPLQTGFAQSDYLRNFGVVLVNVNDGSMHPYLVDNSPDFLSTFFRSYYANWNQSPPKWLAPQLRYPEKLLGTQNTVGQLDVDFTYHVNQPSIWRSGSDFYERPAGTQVYYILANQGNQVYYVGLQLAEFMLSPGHNLGGIYLAYGGNRLNQLSLYRVNPNSTSTNKIIGPRAALQAVETNSQIKEQLTLLSNAVLGNILPYLINGQVYYFIPVYVNTSSSESAVITKLAFMAVVDASNGVSAFGPSSSDAFYSLLSIEGGGQVTVNSITSLSAVTKAFVSSGYSILKPSTVNVNLEFEVGRITLNNMTSTQVNSTINAFIHNYAAPMNARTIYEWSSSAGTNFGIIANENGVVEAYYVAVS